MLFYNLQVLFVVQHSKIASDQPLQASLIHEVGELSEEINVANGLSYKQAGPDGVIGEAIDSIISLVDLIYVYAKENNIELTEENLIRIAEEKLAKWERWELAKSN
jgi:hypothetical protein